VVNSQAHPLSDITQWNTRKLVDCFQVACEGGSREEAARCRDELKRRLDHLESGELVLGKLDDDQALIIGPDGMIVGHVDRDGMVRVVPNVGMGSI